MSGPWSPPQTRLSEGGQVATDCPKEIAPSERKVPRSYSPAREVIPAPSRPGSAPQGWGTHLVVCYQGQHLIHEIDCKVHNLVEQSSAPGEERKLINVSEVGRAPKQKQWEESRRWWSTLKPGDLGLSPQGAHHLESYGWPAAHPNRS